MALLLLLLEIIATVVLLGLAGMFVRLFDALVSTPQRIRSRLGNAPPSSLLGNFQPRNNTRTEGKQILQRKHPDTAENGWNVRG
ncbi:hypothetical protein V6N13_121116 [Hibiscus sabdariffa]